MVEHQDSGDDEIKAQIECRRQVYSMIASGQDELWMKNA